MKFKGIVTHVKKYSKKAEITVIPIEQIVIRKNKKDNVDTIKTGDTVEVYIFQGDSSIKREGK